MSSTIDVYAVSEEQLKHAIGSGDRVLAETVLAGHRDFFSRVDEIDDESELKTADALRELIDGQPSGNGGGYVYGYALKAICAQLGEELPNISGISGASEWIEEVDALLEQKGVPVRLNGLVYGGSPVRIPEPDDYPFIGKWATSELPAAKTAFDNADLSDVNPEMAETLQQMRGWVETTAKTPGVLVVGFLS